MKDYILKGIMWIILALCAGIFFASVFLKDTNADYDGVIKYGKHNLPVRIYDVQIDNLKKRGFSTGEIIDLIAIRNKECGRKDGLCVGFTGDLGFYQVNHIHKIEYARSKYLLTQKDTVTLWNYQSKFARRLFYSKTYEKLCGVDAHISIGKEFNEENYFKCKMRLYNGSSKKKFYSDSGWETRKEIKKYILEYLTK